MHIQSGQDLSRLGTKILIATVGNFNGRNNDSVVNAANEIAGRISRNQIIPNDQKSLRKQLDNISDATINPGVDIVYAAFARKDTLDKLTGQILNYQPGDNKRPVIAAANEIVRRSKEEPDNPDIELALIKIGELEQYPVNPGREIIEKYLLEKVDLNDLIKLITSPPSNNEEKITSAVRELVRRDEQAAMQCRELTCAFRSVFSVADQLEIPGIEILKEHAGKRAEIK